MGQRAEAGTCMAEWVRLAVPSPTAAEDPPPRTGPGDKPHPPEWLIAALLMIAVLKGRLKPPSSPVLRGRGAY
jgi:hypothetical protein